MIEEWRLSEWREDAEQRTNAADAHLVFADRIVRLLDALEAHESEGWAAYAAEQERHAETAARLELMTREARLSREATEKAVRSRVARHDDGVPGGLHSCGGCGLELDADDPNNRCDECESADA